MESAPQSSQFIPLDQLVSPRDLGTDEAESDMRQSLDMDTDDLRLLGFQLVEPEDVVGDQRASKVEVTYTAGPRDPSKLTTDSYTTRRSVLLSPDTEDGAAQQKRPGNEVNLVL